MSDQFHDFDLSEIILSDLRKLRSNAISQFVLTNERDQITLIINQFLGYLQSKNYKIVKLQREPKQTFTGVLMYLDGIPDRQGESFSKKCIVDTSKTVPVSLYFSKTLQDQLGTATLSKRENKIFYNITLFKELPKQLLESLVPCVGGSIRYKRDSVINRISIESIGLTMQNVDSRITPLVQNG